MRLSIPGPGQSISSVAEERGRFIRRSVSLISESIRNRIKFENYNKMFGNRLYENGFPSIIEPLHVRVSWALINVWLLGRIFGALTRFASFVDAENWFVGSNNVIKNSIASTIPKDVQRQAIKELEVLSFDNELEDLLPYVLDPHGPGSRLSVMRDVRTARTRATKKQHGIFYTPSDVAEYMARETISQAMSFTPVPRILDPACGTGVFLLASFKTLIKKIQNKNLNVTNVALQSLYGIDASILSIETCTFVLLHSLMREIGQKSVNPWGLWHAIRLNLAAADSCRLTLAQNSISDENEISLKQRCKYRSMIRESLLGGECIDVSADSTAKKVSREQNKPLWEFSTAGILLHDLFPEIANGAEVLLGNPPYAAIGKRQDFIFITHHYKSISSRNLRFNDQIYPFFVELSWKLTRIGQNASSLVLPLSIAYHRGHQFKACRRAIRLAGGLCRFAFFDREPHALFGEDVKTRNAIFFRFESDKLPPRGKGAIIETTNLIRWTSRTRKELFNSIQYTPINVRNITNLIPKLGGNVQEFYFKILTSRYDSFDTLATHISSCSLADIPLVNHENIIYVGGTAYNFLNVFRNINEIEISKVPFSKSKIHCLQFEDEITANMVFAILTSRFTYWLWHVMCDGFHVPRWFIKSIPFGQSSFDQIQQERLSDLGKTLWNKLKKNHFVYINGGKQTISFRPELSSEERNEVDSILASVAGIPEKSVKELDEFVRRMVVIDEADKRRVHLLEHFRK